MSDLQLRELERQAIQDGPEAMISLGRRRCRVGDHELTICGTYYHHSGIRYLYCERPCCDYHVRLYWVEHWLASSPLADRGTSAALERRERRGSWS